MTKQRVALVTGASSGFGDLIATNLIQTGMLVYGTSRQPTPQFTVLNVPAFHAVPEVDGTHSDVFIILNVAPEIRDAGPQRV